MATGNANKGGRALAVNISAEVDETPFVALQIEDDETLDEIADVLFTEESDVDDFLAEVTAAVEKFRDLRRAANG